MSALGSTGALLGNASTYGRSGNGATRWNTSVVAFGVSIAVRPAALLSLYGPGYFGSVSSAW